MNLGFWCAKTELVEFILKRTFDHNRLHQELYLVVGSEGQDTGKLDTDTEKQHGPHSATGFHLLLNHCGQGMSFIGSHCEHILSNTVLTWFKHSGNLYSLQNTAFSLQGF